MYSIFPINCLFTARMNAIWQKHLHGWNLLKSTSAFLLLFILFISGEKIHFFSTCFWIYSYFSGMQHQHKSKGWCRVIKNLAWGWPEQVWAFPSPSFFTKGYFEIWMGSLSSMPGTQEALNERELGWFFSLVFLYIVVTMFLLELKRFSLLGPWMTVWRKSLSNQDHPCQTVS